MQVMWRGKLNKKWRLPEAIAFTMLLLSGFAVSAYSATGSNVEYFGNSLTSLAGLLILIGYINWLFVAEKGLFGLSCGLVLGTTANTIHVEHQVLGAIGLSLTSISMLLWNSKLRSTS